MLLCSCTQQNEKNISTQVVKGYADLVLTNYQDSLETAKKLQEAINAFINNPTQETLDAAKKSWLTARVYYNQTEGYRFYDGPIDDEDGPEALLNAWPMDEVYIDYVAGNANGGIINNTAMTITAENLISLNEKDGDANISTGYHAIEFLLWGQDLSTDDAGQRSYKDYVDAKNHERRAQYLQVVANLLIKHLQHLVDEWSDSENPNYRTQFLKLQPQEAIQKILTGIHELSTGELPGERMAVALTNHDQEDEHSCFSDNTCLDIRDNQKSMSNIYFGTYKGLNKNLDVKGIHDWLTTKDPELAKQIQSQIAVVESSIAALTKHRFDRLIAADNPEGNTLVKNTIKALNEQGELFAKALEKAKAK